MHSVPSGLGEESLAAIPPLISNQLLTLLNLPDVMGLPVADAAGNIVPLAKHRQGHSPQPRYTLSWHRTPLVRYQ